MSRPPAPPSLQPPNTAVSAPTMTETQKLPNLPPPSFLGPQYRRLPQPVQLPPLAIPSDPSVRPQYQFRSPNTQSLPSIQPIPPPHHHLRAHSGSGAPLEKLLASNSYTPPRSDPPYSPQQYGPSLSPHSEIESRQPPRRLSDRYPIEDSRPLGIAEPPLVSPIEPLQRHAYPPLPSPSYSYSSSNTPYRGSVGSHRASTSSLAPIAYSEPSTAVPRPGAPAIPSAPPQLRAPDKQELKYELIVRQQPIAARACGFGERDRRVIDPPPIIQLVVRDMKTGKTDIEEMRYCLNVLHCTLWSADGTNEETALVQPERRTTRRLMGQLVASPSVAKDEHDVEGCFFCFPDLSCRTHGQYRLRFLLLRIDPADLHVGGHTPILTEVLTDIFTVYTAKDFPGMRPSSALTRALKLQGCNIQVKKGNEKALVRKRVITSGDDEEVDEERDTSKGRRRRKE